MIMKETYYTENTIQTKSAEFLSTNTLHQPQKPFSFLYKQSALLVLDMQEYFLNPKSHAYIPSAPAILPNIRLLLSLYHQQGWLILFTRHLNSITNARMMSRWWRDLITEEHPYSKIIPDLNTDWGTIINKPQYDAFMETSLKMILHEQNIQQVCISGVMTHLCCETTARSAFMHGFEVLFLVDCTATYNEAYHKATLLNCAHGFAIPILSQQIIEQTRK